MNENDTFYLKISQNGQIIQSDEISPNRGFLFGDGLFETMIYTRGDIRYKLEHLKRLKKGCEILKLSLASDTVLDDLEDFLQKEYGSDISLRIRWNIYRNGLGRYTPLTNDCRQLFMIQQHTHTSPSIKKAYINSHLRVPKLPWSNCKTLNALVYVMANLDREQLHYDEVILLNSDGHICEAGAANLFWKKDSVFYTPSLDSDCIAGIGRQVIINELKSKQTELVEGRFESDDLLSAEQIFTTNVTGIHYISQIGEREFNTSPLPSLENLFI
jgi:4-amino-4-deoxychorismate lyase